MRLYAPKQQAVDGGWNPPPIKQGGTGTVGRQ